MLWVLREITEDKGKLMNQLEFKANTCDRFASAGKNVSPAILALNFSLDWLKS